MQMRLHSQHPCACRQRGTAYILVLGITTMLVVMGISGAMLGRVAVETSDLQQNQAIARLAAEVALDVTHKQLNVSGDAWRSEVVHDTWGTGRSYAGAVIFTKYTDEIDGDLTNDTTQPFRVHTLAVANQAARSYSIEMIPDGQGGYTRNARTLRQETLDQVIADLLR